MAIGLVTASPKHASGRFLAHSTVWNTLGYIAPLAVAVFCIPVLIRGLGKDRFGVLTLMWSVLGYASLFDLGLGRAVTQSVARKLGNDEEAHVPSLAWTSVAAMTLLGCVGGFILFVTSAWLVRRALNIPLSLQLETLRSFHLLSFLIPVVIVTSGLRGLLEAYQRFGLLNALRIPLGIFSYVGPLIVLPFSRALFPVVCVLAVGRLLAFAAHFLLCLHVVEGLRSGFSWQSALIGPLLRLGGWMTVSNIVSPLMVTLDRFLVSGLVSVAAVAYYVAPWEMITKLLYIPAALAGVLFPTFSTSFVQDLSRTTFLYRRALKYLFIIMFPLLLVPFVLAPEILRIWVGPDFANASFHVLRWLALGVLINSLSQVPFALVQGIGRPDLTAKMHLVELPLYLVTLRLLVGHRGIDGAAIAWTARIAVDAMVMFFMARFFVPRSLSITFRAGVLLGSAALAFALALAPQTLGSKAVFLGAAILVFALLCWLIILSPAERKVMSRVAKA